MYLFILAFTILYAILAWRRLDLATAGLIAVLPVYQIRFNLWFFPMTLLELMIITLFLIWFIKSYKNKEFPSLLSLPDLIGKSRKKNIKPYPFRKEITAILVIAFISMLYAGADNASLGILKAYFIEPIMFFIVFINIFKFRKNRAKIFLALAISALFISAFAIYQRITGELLPSTWQNSGRVTGVFLYPNALGLYLGSIVMVLLGWLLSLRVHRDAAIPFTKERYNIKEIASSSLALLLAMTILSIYFAKSEGALIGIAVALFIFGLLYNKKLRLTTVGITVVFGGILFFNIQSREYIISKVLLRDLSGQIRRQQWAETWRFLSDNPKNFIFGAGLADYQNAIAPYHQEGIFVRDYSDSDWRRKVVFNDDFKKQVWQPTEIYLYPHNILLNFWIELGIFGALAFVWLVIKLQITNYKLQVTDNKNREIILGLMGAMVVIVVHGLVDVPYFKNDLAVIFWMLMGMIGVFGLELKNNIVHRSGKQPEK